MRIFITGGSGYVGKALSLKLLKKGHNLLSIGTSSTHPYMDRENFHYISADTTEPGIWQEEISKCEAVINLAGRNIFKYWTKKYKEQIYQSRILTTKNIVDAVENNQNTVMISTSAAGYYGDRADEILKEETVPGNDFLAQVCIDWENEALKARKKNIRTAVMRFGVVLGRDGGALSKMLPAFRMFLGGPLGSGRQWFPWIHMDDLTGAVEFVIDNKELSGPFNLTAPVLVRNREFAKIVGKCLNRPSFMPAPAFMIKMMMGELGSALLSSQRALPGKLIENGFEFQYPQLEKALLQIIDRPDS